MKVYYEDDLVTLYHGDCRDLLPTLEDRSVKAVITDPPFSERTHTMARSHSTHAPAGGRALSGSKAQFGSITDDDLMTAFTHLGRISQGWVVSNLDYVHAFGMEQDPPEGLRMLRIGAWVKTNPMPIFSGDRPGMGWEALAYLHRTDVKPSWHGGGKAGNFVMPTSQGTGHPTSKPLDMVRQWVLWFTDPGDVILDPFAGAGTTLRAAVDLGRRVIACEVREDYCELIVRRLSQGAFSFG